MIFLLLIILVAIAVGALLGTLIGKDAGYVMVSYDGYVIESTVC